MLQNDPVYTVKVKPGWVRVSYSKNGIKEVFFPTKKSPYCRSINPPLFVKKAGKQLQSYYNGKNLKFTVPLDLSGFKKFELAVWRATKTIPYGQTRSYEWIAKCIGKPKAARAVGNALGRNPVPVIIPCHRAIRKDGTLGGFGGGAGWKKYLLKLETLKK